MGIVYDLKMEVEFDQQENAYKVLIGVTKESLSTEITGGSTRSGKFKEYYREAKTTLSLIGKNNQEFSRYFKDFKGSLYQKGTKVGFDCDVFVFGYMTVSLKDGLKEGALAVVGTTGQSISYSIVPCVYAKFAIEGSLESGFKLVLFFDRNRRTRKRLCYFLLQRRKHKNICGYERIWSILANKSAAGRRIIEKTKMGIYNYERNNRSYNIFYYAHHIWWSGTLVSPQPERGDHHWHNIGDLCIACLFPGLVPHIIFQGTD